MSLMIRFCMFIIIPGMVSAQETTVDFLPQDNMDGYELLEYTMLPEGDRVFDDDEMNSIKFRFFTKPLPGRWLNEYESDFSEEESDFTEEEAFVSLMLEAYQELAALDELVNILDPTSFSKREERYDSDERTAFYEDSTRFDNWMDVRPFALVRYANIHLILCDVKMADAEEDDDEYEFRLIPTVYLDNEYRLTEVTGSTYGTDLIVNNFFFKDSYDGEIWAALRLRAGIRE